MCDLYNGSNIETYKKAHAKFISTPFWKSPNRQTLEQTKKQILNKLNTKNAELEDNLQLHFISVIDTLAVGYMNTPKEKNPTTNNNNNNTSNNNNESEMYLAIKDQLGTAIYSSLYSKYKTDIVFAPGQMKTKQMELWCNNSQQFYKFFFSFIYRMTTGLFRGIYRGLEYSYDFFKEIWVYRSIQSNLQNLEITIQQHQNAIKIFEKINKIKRLDCNFKNEIKQLEVLRKEQLELKERWNRFNEELLSRTKLKNYDETLQVKEDMYQEFQNEIKKQKTNLVNLTDLKNPNFIKIDAYVQSVEQKWSREFLPQLNQFETSESYNMLMRSYKVYSKNISLMTIYQDFEVISNGILYMPLESMEFKTLQDDYDLVDLKIQEINNFKTLVKNHVNNSYYISNRSNVTFENVLEVESNLETYQSWLSETSENINKSVNEYEKAMNQVMARIKKYEKYNKFQQQIENLKKQVQHEMQEHTNYFNNEDTVRKRGMLFKLKTNKTILKNQNEIKEGIILLENITRLEKEYLSKWNQLQLAVASVSGKDQYKKEISDKLYQEAQPLAQEFTELLRIDFLSSNSKLKKMVSSSLGISAEMLYNRGLMKAIYDQMKLLINTQENKQNKELIPTKNPELDIVSNKLTYLYREKYIHKWLIKYDQVQKVLSNPNSFEFKNIEELEARLQVLNEQQTQFLSDKTQYLKELKSWNEQTDLLMNKYEKEKTQLLDELNKYRQQLKESFDENKKIFVELQKKHAITMNNIDNNVDMKTFKKKKWSEKRLIISKLDPIMIGIEQFDYLYPKDYYNSYFLSNRNKHEFNSTDVVELNQKITLIKKSGTDLNQRFQEVYAEVLKVIIEAEDTLSHIKDPVYVKIWESINGKKYSRMVDKLYKESGHKLGVSESIAIENYRKQFLLIMLGVTGLTTVSFYLYRKAKKYYKKRQLRYKLKNENQNQSLSEQQLNEIQRFNGAVEVNSLKPKKVPVYLSLYNKKTRKSLLLDVNQHADLIQKLMECFNKTLHPQEPFVHQVLQKCKINSFTSPKSSTPFESSTLSKSFGSGDSLQNNKCYGTVIYMNNEMIYDVQDLLLQELEQRKYVDKELSRQILEQVKERKWIELPMIINDDGLHDDNRSWWSFMSNMF